MKKILIKFLGNDILLCLTGGVLLNFLIEILSRRSFSGAVSYAFSHPLRFLYCSAIIMITLSSAMWLKRRMFGYAVVGFLWVVLGIINCCVLFFRTTPLSAVDFRIVRFLLTMITSYLNVIHIVLIVLAVTAIIAASVVAFGKCRKKKVDIRRAALTLAGLAVIICAGRSFSTRVNAVPENFDDLGEACGEYGFVYCFAASLLDTGVDRPESYSEEEAGALLEKFTDEAGEPEEKPTVIVLQLESFLDAELIKTLDLSSPATPVFASLKESCAHGRLFVPSRGGATANVEFEVLSGMPLDFFGPGEYPYQTVLKSTACPSAARAFAENGYVSHAMHNHIGEFYDRDTAYSMLGFDTFTSVESMTGVEYNLLGWERDGVLKDEIIGAVGSTEGPDFIFAVGVETHGKYPTERPEDAEYEISVEKNGTANTDAELEYYVNALHSVDTMLGELIEELSSLDEKVVLIVYGDHQPALLLGENDLGSLGLFSTEYAVWTNYEKTSGERDLYTYQLLYSELDRLGINGGVIGGIHKAYANGTVGTDEYMSALEFAEYDMLYGEGYLYTDGSPEPTEIESGWRRPRITGVVNRENGQLTVYGEGFNEYSKVYINDKPRRTKYVSESALTVSGGTPRKGARITVRQVNNTAQFGCSDEFVAGAEKSE
ncbi:MAG: LTA synthase family protein [Firmicutes bacterium]|nr:LTA synthase family protein [Bacillota bacterium]